LFCEIKDFPKEFKTFLPRHPERNDVTLVGERSRPRAAIALAAAQGSTKNYRQKTQKADSSASSQQVGISPQNDGYYLDILPKYNNSHTAYIPIMTGCNNFCSYCVVPYARGREVSRPAEEIISEVKQLVKNGYREIILLGQNVNSYSYDTKNLEFGNLKLNKNLKLKIKNSKSINFSNLLEIINNIPGNFWIWFISNHPKDFSDELIETATKCKKICECIHLPIQAGDDNVLARMNRKYTAKKYLTLVRKIKLAFEKNKPGQLFSITSDIIVGFPGETKKQFLESAKVMEKAKYDMVFFGQFSPRPGTAAWKLKDNVTKKEKVRRENYLNEILKYTTYENNKKYLGKTIEVLITSTGSKSPSETVKPIYFGHTRTMKNVKIISDKKDLVGKIIKAKITKANIWNLEACLTKRQAKIK
jgi:tRNA-2-methylthio-N6-dimethylallyladenosine synthase